MASSRSGEKPFAQVFKEALQADPEWSIYYLDYDVLEQLIIALKNSRSNSAGPASLHMQTGFLSMGVPDDLEQETSSRGPQESEFVSKMEGEITKIDRFTQQKSSEFHERMERLERLLSEHPDEQRKAQLIKDVERLGNDLLRLEKFVNINFRGCNNVLELHDQEMPVKCVPVFEVILQKSSFVKITFNDLLAVVSRMMNELRGTKSSQPSLVNAKSQKRWFFVKTENVTQIKWMILRHLPIENEHLPENSDSQLVNSVYLDNPALELYNDRVVNMSALALRLRWYGHPDPRDVYIEQKQHSKKERFMLHEKQVGPFLALKYRIDDKIAKLRAHGTPEPELEALSRLAASIQRTIEVKQLVPTLRTQYMRSAYQMPNDESIRLSLDTSLCMLMERPKAGSWYRPDSLPVKPHEITRFPHAVLECRLKLAEGQSPPAWLTELLSSGMVKECPLFSKYVHGIATLLQARVQQTPTWFNDQLLQHYLEDARRQSLNEPLAPKRPTQVDHVTASSTPARPPMASPHTANTLAPAPRIAAPPITRQMQGLSSVIADSKEVSSSWCCWGKKPKEQKKKAPTRVEPKVYFANERTYLHWTSLSVTLATLAIALVSLGKHDPTVYITGFAMIGVAMMFCLYSLYIFNWRTNKLDKKDPGPYEDRIGPQVMAWAIVGVLLVKVLVNIVVAW